MKPSYVYDIETEDWTTFVVGAIYDGKTVQIFRHTCERDFVSRLLSLKGEVYAHNGGRFDHLWLLDASYRYGLQRHAHVIENSTGIISLDFGYVKFLDSFRLFPMSLRRFTSGGKVTKDDLSDLCNCGKACGGYCAIKRVMPRATRKRVEDYLARDVRGLWESLSYFSRLANEIGVELGLTIGSTSWKSAAAELDLPAQPYGKSIADWKFVRESYYGGRSEIFRTESNGGMQYDVNSMYPSKIASVALPVDYKGRRYGRSASLAYSNGYAGSYRAIVRVPESFIPPLPLRNRKGRVLFPTGTINGVWTAFHLRYAESQGCRIESISEGAIFNNERVIFKAWVERIFQIRMKYGKDSREGYWLKLILNSITGKFGAKVTHRSLLIDPCFGGDNCKGCGSKKIDDIEGWNSVGPGVNSRVWFREYERIQACGHVEWAAYLTSASAITLHQGLIEGGNDDAVYCDTDGLFAESERKHNVGDNLGQWKCEGGYEDFVALAPKVYCYHKSDSGIQIVRAKGIPNPNQKDKHANQAFWRSLIESKPIEYWSIAGLRNPQQGRFFVRRILHRTVRRNLGGRLPGGDTLTRAPTAREVESF